MERKLFQLLIDLCAAFTQRDRRPKEEQGRLWFLGWNLCILERYAQSEIVPEHYYPTILARMLKNTWNVFLWTLLVETSRTKEQTARKEGKNFDISSWSGSIIIYPVRRHNKIGEWWWICTTVCSYTCVVCLVGTADAFPFSTFYKNLSSPATECIIITQADDSSNGFAKRTSLIRTLKA